MIHDPVTTAREYPMVSSNAKPLLMSLLSAIALRYFEWGLEALKKLGLTLDGLGKGDLSNITHIQSRQ